MVGWEGLGKETLIDNGAAECHSDPGCYRGRFLSAGSPLSITRLPSAPSTHRAARGMMLILDLVVQISTDSGERQQR
jgi:hypothetical protein